MDRDGEDKLSARERQDLLAVLDDEYRAYAT